MTRPSRRLAGPVLLALLAAGLIGVASPVPTLAGSFSSTDESTIFSLINQARKSAGLAPLKSSSALHSVAEWRSSDMINHDWAGHRIPADGCNYVNYELRKRGISYRSWGEIYAWNTYSDSQAAKAAFNWWMSSSTHRSVILNKYFTSVGVGAYKGTWTYGPACGQYYSGKTYSGAHMFTVVFIQGSGSTSTVSSTPKPAVSSTPKPTTAAAPTTAPTAAPTAAAITPAMPSGDPPAGAADRGWLNGLPTDAASAGWYAPSPPDERQSGTQIAQELLGRLRLADIEPSSGVSTTPGLALPVGALILLLLGSLAPRTRRLQMPERSWTEKRERQYEHIKAGYRKRGVSEAEASERAARTVNRERREAGEAKPKE